MSVAGWLGAGLGVLGATLLAALRALGRGAVEAGRATRAGGRRVVDSLRRGVQAGVVWRARRARKAKLVVTREEAL